MKKCPKCNADIQENARFCLYCMTSFEDKEKVSTLPNKKRRYIVLIIAVIFALVLSGVVLAFIFQGESDENSSSGSGEIISHDESFNSSNELDLSYQSIESSEESEVIESSQISDTSDNFIEPESSKESPSKTESSEESSSKTESSEESSSKTESSEEPSSEPESSEETSSKTESSEESSSKTESSEEPTSETESSEEPSSEPEISQEPKITYVVTDTITAELVGSTLTINGTGALPGRSMEYPIIPWYNDRNKITSIIINNGITGIGYQAFKNHSNVKSVKIPDGVTKIGYDAFHSCFALESVTIPGSVTIIDESAFAGCHSLKSVFLSEGLMNIETNSFAGCDELTSIKIPDSVLNMGASAFQGCKSLREVVFSKKLKSIGMYAFSDCSALENIEIPSGVKYIGTYAFSHCTSLNSIYIPSSVTSIAYDSFYSSSVDSIIVEAGNTVYQSKNNCLIETASKTLLLGSRNGVIPSDGSVTSINSHAFFDISNVKSITIPKSITKIDFGAFSQCQSLEKIIVEAGNTSFQSKNNCLIETSSKKLLLGCKNSIIPADGSVTSIWVYAFSGCVSLESIVLPDCITEIGVCSFSGCTSLESIKIPSSVTEIGSNAFEGCSSLKGVDFSVQDGWVLNTIIQTVLPILNNSETNATYLTETYVSNTWMLK